MEAWKAGDEAHVCKTRDLFVVGGGKPPDASELSSWVQSAMSAGMRVIVMIDENLCYTGGVFQSGSEILKQMMGLLGDVSSRDVTAVSGSRVVLHRLTSISPLFVPAFQWVRSGNDSDKDMALYASRGAHGTISKARKFDDVVAQVAAGWTSGMNQAKPQPAI